MRLVGSATGLGPGLATIALALVLFLSGGTLVRGWSLWRRSDPNARSRWRSVATWWALSILFLALLILGPPAVTVVMAVLSGLLLREALRLVDARRLLLPGVGVVTAVYLWAWLDGPALFLRVLPTVMGGFLAVEAWWRMTGNSNPTPRLDRARSLVGAAFLAVVGPAYVVAVASLAPPPDLPRSGMGWFALLFVLTELNDSAQAWGGRTLGVRRMAPELSPGKTWAGFWSGVLTTVAAAVVVAPLITSYGRTAPLGSAGVGIEGPGGAAPGPTGELVPPWVWAVALGALVALAGVLGDLLESSLKRRAGVKDSGEVLPGHGGLMDRFDSLALTAPVFYGLTRLLW